MIVDWAGSAVALGEDFQKHGALEFFRKREVRLEGDPMAWHFEGFAKESSDAGVAAIRGDQCSGAKSRRRRWTRSIRRSSSRAVQAEIA